jgi:hypothetical protein
MKKKAILKDYFKAITNVASKGDARGGGAKSLSY